MFVRIIQVAVPFIWFGLVGAISFIETPLKFQAPGITLPLGLGIGRIMFFVMNKIELVFAATMLITFFVQRPGKRFSLISFATIAAILLAETLWLLPALDARTTMVINGTAEPFSNLHLIYIALDAAKIILLFALGYSLAKEHLTTNGY